MRKPETKADSSQARNDEVRWVLLWVVAIVLLASVPYLWGMSLTPAGYKFLGLTQNIDDGAVYLSWTRQAADGHFFERNLFTNLPQSGRQVNLLFLLIGWTSRLTGLSCIAAYHLFRVLLGVGLLLMIYRFASLALSERRERLLLIPLVGLSSGIGWLIPNVQSPVGSVDVWQPEAITFLSIYLNPLFLAGQILMLGSLYCLLQAQNTGGVRYAVYAGLCLFLLGNIHTYDVVTIGTIWLIYYSLFTVYDLPSALGRLWLSLVAAAIAAPAVAYQFWVYSIDPVYRLRANTPTPSPPVWAFFEGYGLVLAFAIAGAVLAMRNGEANLSPDPSPEEGGENDPSPQPSPATGDGDRTRNARLLLVVWAVVGFAAPYIPIAQQRKLVMGLHIPLCILAAIAISRMMGRLRSVYATCFAAGLIILMFQSNARFLSLDMSLLSQGRTVTRYAPYMSVDQLNTMRWLKRDTSRSATIFCPPQMALFLPGFAGRQVYYGHWSETPDYEKKLAGWVRFIDPSTTEQEKMEILNASGADYVIFDQPFQGGPLAEKGKLSLIGGSGPVGVFEVKR